MKKILTLAVLTLGLFEGCGSTLYVGGLEIEPQAMQHILNGKKVSVGLSSGAVLSGFVFRTTADSLWLNVGNEEWAIPDRSIEKIQIPGGAVQGGIIGGVSLGVIGAAATPPPRGGFLDLNPGKVFVGVAGCLIGSITGAIVGAILDPTITYCYLPRDTTYIVRGGGSLDDTLNVTVNQFLVDGPSYFIGKIGEREYRFEKAEATYSWERTATGVNVKVRGTRRMFLRLGVPVPS